MLALLVAVAIWYLRADWALAARGRRWPGGRTAAFMAGLVSIDIALQSSVATFTGTYFQAHVIQHLLLMAVAPPLLALGAPSTLLLQTAGRKTKQRWIALLRSAPFAVLSHPITAWFLYFGLMVAFFLTPLINVAMNHMALMDFLNLTFFFGGTLYWWPMIGNDPIMHGRMGHGARMLNILLGSGVEAFLGVAILANVHPIASMYNLSSTHAGGALLWTSTEVVTLAAFVPIYLQWMRSEDRVRGPGGPGLGGGRGRGPLGACPAAGPPGADGVGARMDRAHRLGAPAGRPGTTPRARLIPAAGAAQRAVAWWASAAPT